LFQFAVLAVISTAETTTGYAGLNMVDINSVIVLTVAGCATALMGVRLTTAVAQKTLVAGLGGVVTFLGAFILIQTLI